MRSATALASPSTAGFSFLLANLDELSDSSNVFVTDLREPVSLNLSAIKRFKIVFLVLITVVFLGAKLEEGFEVALTQMLTDFSLDRFLRLLYNVQLPGQFTLALL